MALLCLNIIHHMTISQQVWMRIGIRYSQTKTSGNDNSTKPHSTSATSSKPTCTCGVATKSNYDSMNAAQIYLQRCTPEMRYERRRVPPAVRDRIEAATAAATFGAVKLDTTDARYTWYYPRLPTVSGDVYECLPGLGESEKNAVSLRRPNAYWCQRKATPRT